VFSLTKVVKLNLKYKVGERDVLNKKCGINEGGNYRRGLGDFFDERGVFEDAEGI
jgi:hypothetical protein